VHHYGQGHGKGSLKPSSSLAAGSRRMDEEDEDDDGDTDDEEGEDAADATQPPQSAVATTAAAQQEGAEAGGAGPGAEKRQQLQRVAGQTARTARRQRHRAAEIEQAEQAHQSLVSRGATLAGVVVGGVVIGALTAGVGLVPYLGLVGTAAVVSGGAVAYTAAQAPSSRVVLAAESEVGVCGGIEGSVGGGGAGMCVCVGRFNDDMCFKTTTQTQSLALRWKGALELQVAVLEGRRPPPPPEIDLQVGWLGQID
jgi:hypothetical protein